MARDLVESRASAESVSRIHLHPDCKIIAVGARDIRIMTDAGPFVMQFVGEGGSLRLEESWYCPEFGKRVPNKAVAWIMTGSNLLSGFCVAPGAALDSFDLRSGATVRSNRFRW